MAFNLKTVFSSDNRDLKKGAKEAKQAVKDFEQSTDDALNHITQIFGASFNDIEKSVSAMKGAFFKLSDAMSASTKSADLLSKAMKVLKVALVSTGIGALLVALGSLVAYFTKSQKGADQLSRFLAPLKQTFATLGDYAIKLGEGIVWCFQNPKQAINSFIALVKRQIVNRFEGLIDQFKAFGKVIKSVFTLDWDGIKEGVEDAKNASIQVLTGLTAAERAQFKKNTEEILADFKKRNEAAVKLEEDRQAFRMREIKDKERLAELEAEIADAREKASDKEGYSEKERLTYIQKAKALTQEASNIRIALLKTELDFKQRENQLSTSMDKDLAAESEIRIQIKNAEAAASRELKGINKEQQRISKEVAAELAARQKIQDLIDKKASLNLSPVTANITAKAEVQNPNGIDVQFQKIATAGAWTKEQIAALDAELNKLTENIAEGGIQILAEQFGNLMAQLATGKVTIKDIFSALLSYLGTALKQIGSALIAYGVAMDAFRQAFSNPYAAIAAGAALVAAGAVLTSLVGKLSSTNNSVGNQYSSAVSAGQTVTVAGTHQSMRTTNTPEVQVTGKIKVEGSTLVMVMENENKRKNFSA